jgi:hypothetical protein
LALIPLDFIGFPEMPVLPPFMGAGIGCRLWLTDGIFENRHRK